MQTTSLIGQVLGASAPQKPSNTNEASRKEPERSFAEHVDDADRNVDSGTGVNTKQDENNAVSEETLSGSSDNSGRGPDDTGSDNTSQHSESEVENPNETEAAVPVQVDADNATPAQVSLGEAAPDALAQAEGDITQEGALDGDAEQSAVQPGGSALKGEAPVAAGVATSDSKGTSATPDNTVKTAPVDQKTAGESGDVAKIAEGTSDRAAKEGVVAQAQQNTTTTSAAMGQAASAATRSAAKSASQGERGRPGSETADDIKTATAGSAPAKPEGVATTPKDQPRSVFQMQLQNEQAGEARKNRFRNEGMTEVSGTAAPKVAAQTATQTSAMNQAFAAAQAAALVNAMAENGAASPDPGQVSGGSVGAEMPGLPQLLTEAVIQPGTVHRPETPRLVAQQLATAFAQKGERQFDVALNPEELGKVRMRVATTDMGITMIIQTERPETGDLMRRHINELAEEFRRMGFQDISFEFSSGDSAGSRGEQGLGDGSGSGTGLMGAGPDTQAEGTPTEETTKSNPRLGTTGLDMRV